MAVTEKELTKLEKIISNNKKSKSVPGVGTKQGAAAYHAAEKGVGTKQGAAAYHAAVTESEKEKLLEAMPKQKKGGMTKGQKKIRTVMKEFKAKKLKSSSGQKVTNPKQAIAIALSEAGQSKKMKKAASGSFITKGGDYIKDLL